MKELFQLLPILIWLPALTRATGIQKLKAKPDASLSDRIFSDNFLFETAVKSLLDCARVCKMTSGCITFTYSSSSASCRGHALVMTSGSTFQSSLGVRTHIFDTWLYTACTDSSECPADNSECFAGKCLCTPGYYFSLTKYSCSPACPEADLRTEFLYYPNSRIRLNNIYEDFRSLSSCKALCLGTYGGTCRSIDYRFSDGRCIIGAVTALDVPASWDINIVDHDHHQITCA